jgi:hypothetical protein
MVGQLIISDEPVFKGGCQDKIRTSIYFDRSVRDYFCFISSLRPLRGHVGLFLACRSPIFDTENGGVQDSLFSKGGSSI